MEKFISIPATGLGNILVRASDVATVGQASTTSVVVTYTSGLIITITHATAGASDETQRDAIANAITGAQTLKWTDPVKEVSSLPYAVSAVAATLLVQATA